METHAPKSQKTLLTIERGLILIDSELSKNATEKTLKPLTNLKQFGKTRLQKMHLQIPLNAETIIMNIRI